MALLYTQESRLKQCLAKFKNSKPFDHCVIDDFFEPNVAQRLEAEFADYDSPKLFCYNNAIENKKASNDWNTFPALTYRVFSYLNSIEFLGFLSGHLDMELHADSGLHGGGWHLHGDGGNLNPHLDYSLHPKTGLQRKLNIIIYLSQDLFPSEMGGHLGLWEHDPTTGRPGRLAHEIEPLFNRAVLFDTTQNSWHGLSRKLRVPPGIYRKSLAVYYMTAPAPDVDTRGRALFAPRSEQMGDAAIEDLIHMRSQIETSHRVYNRPGA